MEQAVDWLGYIILGGGAVAVLVLFRNELKSGSQEAWVKAVSAWQGLKAWWDSLQEPQEPEE